MLQHQLVFSDDPGRGPFHLDGYTRSSRSQVLDEFQIRLLAEPADLAGASREPTKSALVAPEVSFS
jgi:hypothetical protein